MSHLRRWLELKEKGLMGELCLEVVCKLLDRMIVLVVWLEALLTLLVSLRMMDYCADGFYLFCAIDRVDAEARCGNEMEFMTHKIETCFCDENRCNVTLTCGRVWHGQVLW